MSCLFAFFFAALNAFFTEEKIAPFNLNSQACFFNSSAFNPLGIFALQK